MANYFFDLHECGDITVADEGIDAAGMDEVRVEAIRTARDIMRAEILEGRLCMACHVEVRDDAGNVVLSLPFDQAVTLTGIRTGTDVPARPGDIQPLA